MKLLTKIACFIPALLVLILPSETLAEGLYNKSLGCISTLVLMGLCVWYLFDFSKIKNNGPKVMVWFAIIILSGLTLATLFK